MMLFKPKDGEDLSIDENVARELLDKYGRLVITISNKIYAKFYLNRYGFTRSDLSSMGEALLIYAWKKFDANRGYAFSTYLTTCLINAYSKLVKKTVYSHDIHVGRILSRAIYSVEDGGIVPNDPNYQDWLVSKQSLVNDAICQLLDEKHITTSDLKIYNLRASGKKLNEIGDLFNLSFQRIDQRLKCMIDKIYRRVRVLSKEE